MSYDGGCVLELLLDYLENTVVFEFVSKHLCLGGCGFKQIVKRYFRCKIL